MTVTVMGVVMLGDGVNISIEAVDVATIAECGTSLLWEGGICLSGEYIALSGDASGTSSNDVGWPVSESIMNGLSSILLSNLRHSKIHEGETTTISINSAAFTCLILPLSHIM